MRVRAREGVRVRVCVERVCVETAGWVKERKKESKPAAAGGEACARVKNPKKNEMRERLRECRVRQKQRWSFLVFL